MVTDEQRRQLDVHADAELRFDLDAVMATVDDDPEYEVAPGRPRPARPRRLRRMYASFLPRWKELAETADLRFDVRTEWWNDEGRIREQVAFVRNASGGIDRHDFVVAVMFGKHGVKGERTYSSPEFARLMFGDYYDELRPIERA